VSTAEVERGDGPGDSTAEPAGLMGSVRTIVIGVAIRDDRILAVEGFDARKGERFYRPPGGGLDFGETSEEALRGEWREELDVELAETQYLGTLENVFTFERRPGHEVILVHRLVPVGRAETPAGLGSPDPDQLLVAA
jgi:ADP-ribose pyrophosphatase YjhB (NUDIX family)